MLDGEKFRKAWESTNKKTILGGLPPRPSISPGKYAPDEEESRLAEQLKEIGTSNTGKDVSGGLMKAIIGMQDRSANRHIKTEVRKGTKDVLEILVKNSTIWVKSRNIEDLSFSLPANDLGDATSAEVLEMTENSLLDDRGLKKLNVLRKIRALDRNPRSIAVETVVPGFYLLEFPDKMNTASRFTTKFVGGEKVSKTDAQMNLRQEAIQVLGRELKIDKTNIARNDVHQIEENFAQLEPMSLDFDNQLKEYFDFLTGEIWGVLCNKEAGNITFPLAFYDEEVKNLEQLKEKIINIAIGERKAIKERGRKSDGQIGQWFWDTSSVDTLGEDKMQLDAVISLAVKHLGVNPDEFFRKVSG